MAFSSPMVAKVSAVMPDNVPEQERLLRFQQIRHLEIQLRTPGA